MIDSLFGSKTRVKLLKLFMNNPDNSYFVREITRIIDEQINSVRRELSNMLKVGIITSETTDNKLYYQVDKNSQYFIPLRALFSDEKIEMEERTPQKETPIIGLPPKVDPTMQYYSKTFEDLTGAHAVILAGKLVRGSISQIDILIIGKVSDTKLKSIIKSIERKEEAEMNYTVLTPEEYSYRVSVRDRFISDVLGTKHKIINDVGGIISGGKK